MDDFSPTRAFLAFVMILGWIGVAGSVLVAILIAQDDRAGLGAALLTALPLLVGSFVVIVIAQLGVAVVASAEAGQQSLAVLKDIKSGQAALQEAVLTRPVMAVPGESGAEPFVASSDDAPKEIVAGRVVEHHGVRIYHNHGRWSAKGETYASLSDAKIALDRKAGRTPTAAQATTRPVAAPPVSRETFYRGVPITKVADGYQVRGGQVFATMAQAERYIDAGSA